MKSSFNKKRFFKIRPYDGYGYLRGKPWRYFKSSGKVTKDGYLAGDMRGLSLIDETVFVIRMNCQIKLSNYAGSLSDVCVEIGKEEYDKSLKAYRKTTTRKYSSLTGETGMFIG